MDKVKAPKDKRLTRSNLSTSGPMQRILEAGEQGRLVVIVGAGVSIGLTNAKIPSWVGLIKNGFDYALTKGRITETQLNSWKNQLSSDDIDDLLSAAEFVSRKLGSPSDQVYGRWLQAEFEPAAPENVPLCTAMHNIAALGIPLCTLNYDLLLEKVTGLPSVQVSDTAKVASWMRREHPAIFHLHGSWDNPSSCILGIRDYESTQSNDVRDLIQRSLAVFNTLLFVGCGDSIADPNFSALVKWLKTKFQALSPQHIALTCESDVSKRNIDASWSGFLEPLSYGGSHECLAEFLLEHFPSKKLRAKRKTREAESNESAAALENYRAFLLRDCGQMTIEGISADMDTGQRKFDLERLFVPLTVLACAPEFSNSDPDSDAKKIKWQSESKRALPFGHVLSKKKNIALLALPGGGKTLLLKRLAVAYADPLRRNSSTDALPERNLLPIMIRCRDWREYVRLPILTLLKKIGDITGQSNLSGLHEAIIPLLKHGQILLLIDGLDEIHNDADRITFVDNLESFLEDYKNIQAVITSREAGFNLVAPSLSRICERWRIAPLEEDAITLLCGHWHRLMSGDTPSAIQDGNEVSQIILRSDSLRRLAENPLLLTMLLVVKHGAGSLPPDRVSLYERAVDVLLDTWNIKGHDPLNPKEAVPQLAYIAFQLMCLGKQTATESELLSLLEEARDRHPNIKRYAKDSPHEFLKRVELRSSLLLEAGHQMENGRTVPFYQFRHLTFQEYLTAVAATEGHYKQYLQDDTVLTPLSDYLLTEEWKEVIPMAAVLAKKRAEPLLSELIAKASSVRDKIEAEDGFKSSEMRHTFEKKLSGPAGRLTQCFVEEAEASQSTLAAALQLIAFFAQGCTTADDWKALCQGPYGDELYNQSWLLLISKQWPAGSALMNTAASLAAHRKPVSYWISEQGKSEVCCLLQSTVKEEIGHGLLICMGLIWNRSSEENKSVLDVIPIKLIESYIRHTDPEIWSIATWTWTNTRRKYEKLPAMPTDILDLHLRHWLSSGNDRSGTTAAYALCCQLGIDRQNWYPKLSDAEIHRLIELAGERDEITSSDDVYVCTAAFFVAFHARSVWTEEDLLHRSYIIQNLSQDDSMSKKIKKIRSMLVKKPTKNNRPSK